MIFYFLFQSTINIIMLIVSPIDLRTNNAPGLGLEVAH